MIHLKKYKLFVKTLSILNIIMTDLNSQLYDVYNSKSNEKA